MTVYVDSILNTKKKVVLILKNSSIISLNAVCKEEISVGSHLPPNPSYSVDLCGIFDLPRKTICSPSAIHFIHG
jgi:hypothetical protein